MTYEIGVDEADEHAKEHLAGGGYRQTQYAPGALPGSICVGKILGRVGDRGRHSRLSMASAQNRSTLEVSFRGLPTKGNRP